MDILIKDPVAMFLISFGLRLASWGLAIVVISMFVENIIEFKEEIKNAIRKS